MAEAVMEASIHRRQFIQKGAVAAAAWGVLASAERPLWADSPNDKPAIGIMGLNGRGTELAGAFLSAGAHVAYLCDVDNRAIDKASEVVAKVQSARPEGVKDFRRILDDSKVDALVVAAPDHWHGPATILACTAGKHVYVEKPACHNPQEGEMMIAAARKYNRVVQVGTQRRSMPAIMEAVKVLRSGELGRVLFARGWYNNSRPSIGRGKPASPPSWLDFDLWQGPAPERPYRDNLVHYNWHWFWHWGTGELGNNGIHALDVCRWGLGVDYPLRVSANGGKYFYDDDQETPDTHVVTFDFGDKGITWEGRNWHRRGFEGTMFGMEFYTEQATLVIDGGGYQVLDAKGKQTAGESGGESLQPHLMNFLACLRSGERPHADIEEGHKSTLLCHLGNIAYRTGHTLQLDPSGGHILNDPDAEKLWGREYRSGWEPKV
jgi:predicted dehydrogenase